VQERWDSDPKSVQLAAGSPRPTAADHIELSAGQIKRMNNLMPAVGACVL
jgi:hypothetical protein